MAFIPSAKRIALLFVLLPLGVGAAELPADRLLDERRDAVRAQRLAPDALPDTAATAPALTSDPADVIEHGPTLSAPHIEVNSHGLLTPHDIEAALKPFRAQSLGERRLSLLLRQLDAHLIAAGWVTSRARLAEFRWQDQQIRIELMPGRIERIAAPDIDPTALARVLPVAAGDTLRLDALEQGVQQINRLRMYRANVTIRPGSAVGTSLLELQLDAGKGWTVSLGADNQGQRDTGAERVRLGGRLENRLGLFEDVQVAYVRSERSDALIGSIALPHGFNTWSATVSASQTTSRVLHYEYSSRSLNLALGWNRVLSLSREGREALDLTVTRLRTARKFHSIRLDTERATVLRAAWTRVRQGAGYQYYVEPALAFGLPVFGAADDSSALPRDHVHHEFTKFALDAGIVGRPDAAIELAAQLGAQRARVSIIGAEQLSLGGLASVRGFDEAVVSGDSGYTMRTEARFPDALNKTQFGPVPFAHLDHGVTWLAGGRRNTLSSAGAGIRGIGDGFNWEGVLSAPLRHGTDIERHAWRLHVSLSYEF